PQLSPPHPPPFNLPPLPLRIRLGVKPLEAQLPATLRADDPLKALERTPAFRTEPRPHRRPTRRSTRQHRLTIRPVVRARLLPIAVPANAPAANPLTHIPRELAKRTRLPTPGAPLLGRIVERREE